MVSLISRMAAEVLNELICCKISPDDLIVWLTTDHMVILVNESLILVNVVRR